MCYIYPSIHPSSSVPSPFNVAFHSFIHSFISSVRYMHACMSLPSFLLPSGKFAFLHWENDVSYVGIYAYTYTYIHTYEARAGRRSHVERSVNQLVSWKLRSKRYASFSSLLSYRKKAFNSKQKVGVFDMARYLISGCVGGSTVSLI